MENRVKLSVLGISFSQVQAGAYALILAEENGMSRADCHRYSRSAIYRLAIENITSATIVSRSYLFHF